MLIDCLTGLLAAAAMLIASVGVGRPVVQRLAIATDDALDELIWSLLLGLLSTAVGVGILAYLGIASTPLLALFTWLATLWGLGELLCVLSNCPDPPISAKAVRGGRLAVPAQSRRTAPRTESESKQRFAGSLGRGVWFAAWAVAGATLASALAGSTQNAAPGQAIDCAQTMLLPLEVIGARRPPDVGTALATWGLLLQGRAAATILAWCWGLMLSGSVVLLARQTFSRSWAPLAGGVVLLCPGVAASMAAAHDALASAALCVLSLVAVARAATAGPTPARESVPLPGDGWSWIAGATLGGLLSIDPQRGLVWTAVLAGVSAWLLRDRPHGRTVWITTGLNAAPVGLLVGGPALFGSLFAGSPTAIGAAPDLQCLGPLLVVAAPWLLIAPLERRFGAVVVALGLDALIRLLSGDPSDWWATAAALLAIVFSKLVADLAHAIGDRSATHEAAYVRQIRWPVGLVLCAAAWPAVDAIGLPFSRAFEAVSAAAQERPSTAPLATPGGPAELAETIRALGLERLSFAPPADPSRQPERGARFLLLREPSSSQTGAAAEIASGQRSLEPPFKTGAASLAPLSEYRLRMPTGEVAQFHLYLLR